MKILLLTNIITPYRQHLFNAWATHCQSVGIDYHTAYMAREEPGRAWDPDDYPLNHPHVFYPAVSIPIPGAGRPVRVNWQAWQDLLKGDWDIVIVGGYSELTTVVAPLLPKRGQLRVLWSEGNTFSQGRTHRLVRGFKSMLAGRYDALLVPGLWGRDFFSGLGPRIARKPFVFLPNLVQESLFARARLPEHQLPEARRKWDIPPDHRVLLFVGRLDENKGIHRVIDAVRTPPARPATLLLVGDGDRREIVQNLAAANKALNVRLLGQQPEQTVAELMGLSDALVLPSLRDCWPLVVVEAVTAGLTILSSDRVGNHVDLVQPGRNGWLFDTTSPASIQTAVQQFLTTPDDTLASMKRVSAAFADEHLKTQTVVRRVTEELVALQEAAHGSSGGRRAAAR